MSEQNYNKVITIRLKEPDYFMLMDKAQQEETTISSLIRKYIISLRKEHTSNE